MRIVRATGSSTSGAKNRPGLNLPQNLVDDAVPRLCFASVVIAVCTSIVWLGNALLQPEVSPVLALPAVRLQILAMVLLSAACVVTYKTGVLSKQGVLRLGIVFQVAAAFAIAAFETTVPLDPAVMVRGVSAVALWITLCSLLIPSTPQMNLFANILCVAMWPAAYALNYTLYPQPWIGWHRVAAWTFPLGLTVLWTHLLNRRLYEMRIDATRAEELGSYTLEEKIGEGGMGEVWRAKHRMLSREAAIKLIRPEVLERQSIRDAAMVRRRFEKEAQATASLRSPHTVALYDFGITRDQSFYYVMELLEGVDLQTLVEQHGPLPPGRVQNILIQVCDSLEEAHRLGMIHRDIKPKNIFLCRLGLEFDFAKVLDFGLVKSPRTEEEETLVSVAGSATGTPAYMAPEIAMGSKEVDGRSDLYGLGCVAYFLLTGQLVFQESTRMAAALAHVQKTPVPVSERSETPIPQGLADLVMQCLEKDPKHRVPSAWELARRLEALGGIPRFCRDSAERWWSVNLPAMAHLDPVRDRRSLENMDTVPR